MYDPAIQCRHHVVALSSRDKLVWLYQRPVLIAHTQQQFVMLTRILIIFSNTNYRLIEKFESIFLYMMLEPMEKAMTAEIRNSMGNSSICGTVSCVSWAI